MYHFPHFFGGQGPRACTITVEALTPMQTFVRELMMKWIPTLGTVTLFLPPSVHSGVGTSMVFTLA